MPDPLLFPDDRLIGRLARDVRDYQELLSAALAVGHYLRGELQIMSSRYDRLLEDFRGLQTERCDS